MADSRQRLFFDIFAKDRGAKREFDQLGRSVGKAGDAMDDMGKDARTLDKQISTTKQLIRQLGDEVDRTGNHELFGDIRKERAKLAMLQQIRKELDKFDEPGPKRGSFFSALFDNAGETLKGLPSQLKGAAIVGGVGIGALLAPAVGAAISAAVVGGVGLGGIAGGIALAAQDSRVKSEASKLGQILLGDLKGAASPFVAPLLAEFGELQEIGASFTADLRNGFAKLAPLVKPLVEGLRGLQQNLGPGLATTFKTAQPVIRALANELPRLGDAISDALNSMAGKSREATLGMIGLLRATEGLIRATGDLVGYLEWQFSWLVNFGTELDKVKEKFGIFASTWGYTVQVFTDQSTEMTNSLDDANNATGDFNTTVVGLAGSMYDVVSATEAENRALKDFASGLQDQFDPVANFLHRTEDLKKAQQDLSEAIADHGRNSEQAKAAELRLAEAILASDAAAANAAGTFNGKFSESLRATLRAGHMTEAQINDLEKSARSLTRQLNELEGNYKATVTMEFLSYRAGERDPSGSAAAARKGRPKKKASGGPVMAGNTYLVGEQGPELVTFAADGNVIPAARSKAIMSGAPGGRVDVNVRIDPSGAHDVLSQAIAHMLRVDAAFRATVAGYVGAS